ncbi:hypothetical protein P3S68_026607 [Capsicum galapagoense]
MSLSTVPIFFWCCLGFACFISTKIVCCELLAFRFGRQFAARAGRALFGSSTKQIRGYCQEVTSTSEIPPRNIAIAFVAGGLTSFAGLYYVFGTKLEELQAKNCLMIPICMVATHGANNNYPTKVLFVEQFKQLFTFSREKFVLFLVINHGHHPFFPEE